MELFDKRFVHFMWDDELKGKTGIVSNDIKCLRDYVNNKSFDTELIEHSNDESQPFKTTDGIKFRFAYYDPNYEVKKAFNEGKKVQYQLVGGVDWADIDSEEVLECRIAEGRTFRIKPEEEQWIAYLARENDGSCYLSACTDYYWKAVQKVFGAKTKLFIGTYDEVNKWYELRQKFAPVIKAWEDGKTIQVYETLFKKWGDCAGTLDWHTDCEYRVKPDCPCEDGIDSKACVGCEHSEDGKKEYRPYINSAEMIVDFIDRFNVKCPSYCEPLIWVKRKVVDIRYLVFAFCEDAVKFNDDEPFGLDLLFDEYTYLDGSPVGMGVEK